MTYLGAILIEHPTHIMDSCLPHVLHRFPTCHTCSVCHFPLFSFWGWTFPVLPFLPTTCHATTIYQCPHQSLCHIPLPPFYTHHPHTLFSCHGSTTVFFTVHTSLDIPPHTLPIPHISTNIPVPTYTMETMYEYSPYHPHYLPHHPLPAIFLRTSVNRTCHLGSSCRSSACCLPSAAFSYTHHFWTCCYLFPPPWLLLPRGSPPLYATYHICLWFSPRTWVTSLPFCLSHCTRMHMLLPRTLTYWILTISSGQLFTYLHTCLPTYLPPICTFVSYCYLKFPVHYYIPTLPTHLTRSVTKPYVHSYVLLTMQHSSFPQRILASLAIMYSSDTYYSHTTTTTHAPFCHYYSFLHVLLLLYLHTTWVGITTLRYYHTYTTCLHGCLCTCTCSFTHTHTCHCRVLPAHLPVLLHAHTLHHAITAPTCHRRYTLLPPPRPLYTLHTACCHTPHTTFLQDS